MIQDSPFLSGFWSPGQGYINEAVIRYFLILKIITGSVAKAIATQQRSSDSLAKVVLDNKIALYYFQLNKVSPVNNITCSTCINIPEEVETQLYEMNKNPLCLKERFLQQNLSLTYLILLLQVRDHGSEAHSKHWELLCL